MDIKTLHAKIGQRTLEDDFPEGAFTRPLLDAGIRISTVGRSAWRDNVLVERSWRSVKCEQAYLRADDTVAEARAGIARLLAFCNQQRPRFRLRARVG